MKSGVSPQKTPIWASICTPVAPNLLIFSGHKQSFGGHGPGMPRRGAGSAGRGGGAIAPPTGLKSMQNIVPRF